VKFIVKLVAVFVLGLFTAPPFAEAQQTGKVWRIGYLAVAPFPDLDDAFKRGSASVVTSRDRISLSRTGSPTGCSTASRDLRRNSSGSEST